MPHSPNLSGKETTPELKKAIKLAQNKGRWEWNFYTTLGHVVTKILDMDIAFTLSDGSKYKPFMTVGEVKTFFRISDDDFAMQPNQGYMDRLLSNLYRDKVRPQEAVILDSQKEFVQEFFQQNVWWMVDDSDTIDSLISEIRALVNMGIEEINEYVCEDTIEWIIMNVIWNRKTLADWESTSVDERNKYTVEILDKEKFTDYFVDLVVEHSWRKHPNNSYKMVDEVWKKIRALYVVNDSLEEEVRGVSPRDSFRNTRYL